MTTLLEIFICILAVFGIIFTTASFFQALILTDYRNFTKKNIFKNNKDDLIEINVYISKKNNYNEIKNKLLNDTKLKEVSSDINIYKLK